MTNWQQHSKSLEPEAIYPLNCLRQREADEKRALRWRFALPGGNMGIPTEIASYR